MSPSPERKGGLETAVNILRYIVLLDQSFAWAIWIGNLGCNVNQWIFLLRCQLLYPCYTQETELLANCFQLTCCYDVKPLQASISASGSHSIIHVIVVANYYCHWTEYSNIQWAWFILTSVTTRMFSIFAPFPIPLTLISMPPPTQSVKRCIWLLLIIYVMVCHSPD